MLVSKWWLKNRKLTLNQYVVNHSCVVVLLCVLVVLDTVGGHSVLEPHFLKKMVLTVLFRVNDALFLVNRRESSRSPGGVQQPLFLVESSCPCAARQDWLFTKTT